MINPRTACKRSLPALWLILAALAGGAAGAADRPPSQDLTTFFADVVFGAEFDEVAEDEKIIHKWTGPVRVSVSAMSGQLIKRPDGSHELKMANERPDAGAVEMIIKHLNTLVKYSGVKSEDSKKVGKPANFFIKFVPPLAMHAPFLEPDTDPNRLKTLARDGVCYLIFFAPTGAIDRATLVINSELPSARMDACLLEEMTQAFGLKNDSDIVQPSIFNQQSTSRTLYRTDIILLATLYDEKLKAGMHIKQALPVAAGIIDHLNRVMAPGN
ncbi:MAG: DUF2927 domain-containing protein [Rhodospirillales bacterium]|nr:DUF2927 domain-containing protein [Rhodospirillales bacterium]